MPVLKQAKNQKFVKSLQRTITDYSYSLAKKDRKVKTLFLFLLKRVLETSVETTFLFPYIVSITNLFANVKLFFCVLALLPIYNKIAFIRAARNPNISARKTENLLSLYIWIRKRFSNKLPAVYI